MVSDDTVKVLLWSTMLSRFPDWFSTVVLGELTDYKWQVVVWRLRAKPVYLPISIYSTYTIFSIYPMIYRSIRGRKP